MIQGQFFKVDENSNYQNGQIVFRYLPVAWKNESKQMNEPLYPVYLVLNPYAVDFYYHGLPFDENGKNKDDSKETPYPHAHIRILHLPLSLNLAAKDNLSSRLISFYSGKYKINNKYKQSIDDNFCAYWNLEVFNLAEECSQKKEMIFLRKLILDFIFDLEHSHVFEASPNYEQVEVRLRENYLFSAISAKASYYYNVKIYIENFSNDDIRDIYAERLVDSEKQWLNIIRDERATETFWHTGWFRQVEKEYNSVIFPRDFKRDAWRKELIYISGDTESYDEQNIRILKQSARWYLRRYNIISGIGSILQFYNSRKPLLILLIVICLIIFPAYFLIYNIDANSDTYTVSFILYFLLGLIPLSVASFFALNKMIIPLISASLPRLLMTISSSWVIFSTTEELVKSSFDVRLFGNEMNWAFLLVVPVVLFMAVEIKNLAPELKLKDMFIRISYILGLGLFYSILIGLFFINFYNETILNRSGYLPLFISNHIPDSSKFKLDTELKAIGIGLLNDENDLIEDYKTKYDSILRSTIVIKVLDSLNLQRSFTKAQQTKLAYFHDKINKIDEKEDTAWIKRILAPSELDAVKMLDRVSYKLRIFNLDTLEMKLMYKIPIIKNQSSFEVFPGMLLFRAFFSLFIGIFIQLIFEDKPITEPL